MPLFADSVQNLDKLLEEANAAKAGILLTDASIGLTFATIAGNAGPGSDKRLRNQANARKAYNSITSHLEGTTFPCPEAQRQFDSQVAEPKCALKALGESF